jgi:hypothetical protein
MMKTHPVSINTALSIAPDALDEAIEAVGDRGLDIRDRGLIYVGLRRLRLRIDRALRPITQEFERAMVEADAKSWGPLELRWRAIDVAYPVNEEGNWGDATVQDTLAEWRKEAWFRPFIRQIPAHLEIATAALGTSVHEGDPGAIELWQKLNDTGLRTQGVKVPSLSVKES